MSGRPLEQRFGRYGGQYVPETLMPALLELEDAWTRARDDRNYKAELGSLLEDYVGRPTPLYRARRLSERVGHPIYLKREGTSTTPGRTSSTTRSVRRCSPSGWASAA